MEDNKLPTPDILLQEILFIESVILINTADLLIRTLSGPAVLSFVKRLIVLFRRHTGPIYKSTFGLSFVGRFVLFRSVLYRRFHCKR